MEIKGTRRKKTFLVRRTQDSSPVDTTPEEFQNGSLFLRLGLPSTLLRHENEAFRKRSSNWWNLKTE